MKALTGVALALAAIISLPGFAAAQGVYIDIGPGAGQRPYYRDYYGGGPGYYRYGEGGERGYYPPAGIEPSTGVSPAGLCRTVAASLIAAIDPRWMDRAACRSRSHQRGTVLSPVGSSCAEHSRNYG
jgi:hypothetical protein